MDLAFYMWLEVPTRGLMALLLQQVGAPAAKGRCGAWGVRVKDDQKYGVGVEIDHVNICSFVVRYDRMWPSTQ